MADLNRTVFERYKNNANVYVVGISDDGEASTSNFLLGVQTQMDVVLDNGSASSAYAMWDNVWFPSDGALNATNPGVVLSPYPYDLVIDGSTGKIAYLDREYNPGKIIETIENLLNNTARIEKVSKLQVVPQINVFPNPFKTSITVEIDIVGISNKQINDLQVGIYSVNGELLRSLNFKKRSESKISVTWDGKDMTGKKLPGGIYVYEVMLSGKKIQRQKVILQ